MFTSDVTSEDESPAQVLQSCYLAAVAAADPEPLLARLVAAEGEGGRTAIIAVGKAAEAMARGVLAGLDQAGGHCHSGFLVSSSPGAEWPPQWTVMAGNHPLAGEESAAAALALERYLAGLPPDITVEVLISGGCSAMIGAPLPGISAQWYQRQMSWLFGSGLDIAAVNALRRSLSRWAGGRLAAALAPRRIRLRLLSDVADDDPAVIGSGPCSPGYPDLAELPEVLATLGAEAVAEVDLAGISRHWLPADHPCFRLVDTTLVANNATALRAALAAAASRRIPQREFRTSLSGEAGKVGSALALEAMKRADEWARERSQLQDEGLGYLTRPLLLAAGGETTVTLGTESGRGGRCQELALAAARMLDIARQPITLLAAGSDGIDGVSDAAGAIVDRDTWSAVAEGGIDADAALAGHDSYPALAAAGALLRTGPSGTNVRDMVLALIGEWPEPEE